MRLQGRVAIITGGGAGIGRCMALRFAMEGAAVVVADIRNDAAESVRDAVRASGGRATCLAVDIADADPVGELAEHTLAEHGRIDVLVNNATSPPADNLLRMDPEAWDHDVAVSLRGPFLCTRAVLPSMLEQRAGTIVNIASVNALGFYGREAYSAAKAGLINLTKATAVRYGAKGVRANAIAAGTVRTAAWRERVEQDPDLFDRAAKWYPLGRVGEPGDIANAALFLASDDAGWITGAVLPVDGGLTAGNLRMFADLLPDPDS